MVYMKFIHMDTLLILYHNYLIICSSYSVEFIWGGGSRYIISSAFSFLIFKKLLVSFSWLVPFTMMLNDSHDSRCLYKCSWLVQMHLQCFLFPISPQHLLKLSWTERRMNKLPMSSVFLTIFLGAWTIFVL